MDENHPWFSPLRGALRASKLVLDSDRGFIPDEFLLRFSSSTRIFRDPFKRIGKIMEAVGQPFPKIESNLFFHITFKRPFYTEQKDETYPKISEKTSEKILREIGADKNITSEQLAEKLSLSKRAIEKQIANLKASGKLIRIGSDKAGYWEIKK